MSNRSTRLRRVAPIAAVAAVLFAAVSCGDDDATDTSPDGRATDDRAAALADAASTTLDERSMSFELAYSIAGPDIQQEGSLEGTADFAAGSGDIAATEQDRELRAVIDGDDFWLTSGADSFTSALPDGKQWVHGSIAELGDSEALSRPEPLAILYLLNGARDVTASPDGDATRYSFAVDMAVAAASAPSDRREEVDALIDTGNVEPTVSGEAVVDAENHVRELSVTGNDGSEPPIDISWEASLDDYGDDVILERPPDPEVVSLGDVPEIRDQLTGAT